MKKLLAILILLLPLTAFSQSDSTAIRIVERYLNILNIEALPHDSMLVLTTEITSPTGGDTFSMRRLYAWPQMFLVEVRTADGKLQTGLCGNGTDYRVYSEKYNAWRNITTASFYDRLYGFDFRGPLYNWRNDNAEMTYGGHTTYKGQKLEVVNVSAPGFFHRTYLFEPSGILSAIIENDTIDEHYGKLMDAHIDWKIIHEYQNVGQTIIPALESFMREGELTVMRTEAHLEERNNLLFKKD